MRWREEEASEAASVLVRAFMELSRASCRAWRAVATEPTEVRAEG